MWDSSSNLNWSGRYDGGSFSWYRGYWGCRWCNSGRVCGGCGFRMSWINSRWCWVLGNIGSCCLSECCYKNYGGFETIFHFIIWIQVNLSKVKIPPAQETVTLVLVELVHHLLNLLCLWKYFTFLIGPCNWVLESELSSLFDCTNAVLVILCRISGGSTVTTRPFDGLFLYLLERI